MAPEISIEETERKMRELLDARMDSVRELVKSRQVVIDLRAQLAEAEAKDAQRYAAVLANGWSEAELRKLDIAAPDAKPRARRATRGARRGSAGVNSADTTQGDSTDN